MYAETSPIGDPMSFEEAFLMGRTGHGLSTNVRKLKTSTIISDRNVDLDEEDWC